MILTPLLAEMRAAVVRDPADDTVRLAYADALDEEGGKQNVAHAKIIRMMIRWEREAGPWWFTRTGPAKVKIQAGWVTKRIAQNWPRLVAMPAPVNQFVVGHGATSAPGEWSTSHLRSELALRFYDTRGAGIAIHIDLHCLYYFRRGFLTHVRCHWPHWDRCGEAACAHEPIESVELTTLPPFPIYRQAEIEEKDRAGSILRIRMEELRRRFPSVVTWALP